MNDVTAKGASLETCTLADCPPGLFRGASGALGFRSDYCLSMPREELANWPEAFVVESGEVWWGGTTNHPDRAAQIVTPLDLEALSLLASAALGDD